MDELKWDPKRHDSEAPKPLRRGRIQCKCGGKLFVEVRRLEIVHDGTEGHLDIIALGLLCTKCQNLYDPGSLLKEAIENEGKRPDIKLAPNATEN